MEKLEVTKSEAMPLEPILVFLPSLGADHRLFENQTTAFPNSYAVDWIDPLPKETLEKYVVRLSASIRSELDNRPPSPIVVCGLSLGGMMAPYVARELRASGCILLCTIRGPKEFPRRYYLDWLLMRCCPVLRLIRLSIAQIGARFLLLFPGMIRHLLSPDAIRQFVECPTRRLAGLSRMMFDWAYRRRSPEEMLPLDEKIPTLHIHGTLDLLLPIRLTAPDIRIKGGGHLLVLSHPEEINEAIRKFIDEHFMSGG